ncbi:MAG TPA: glycosyltransferase family 39 protein [Candidatus Acidoferrum sp.]|nr:glycosyltransferase family 39 protein [Candidatus Acidoferrum sp.]
MAHEEWLQSVEICASRFNLLRARLRICFRGTICMVLVALVLRLAVVPFADAERLDPKRDHWQFGGETGRIARSIVQGRGFSSPFWGETGPSALIPPVYPLLLAGIFRLFGTYSKASALVALSLNCLFSALTCLPVFLIARKGFGERVALAAGWTWVFFPYAIFFAANLICPPVLITLLLSLLFLIALHLEASSRLLPWIGFGLLYGLAALTEPVVLSILPALGIWLCYRLHRRGQRWFLPATLGALAFFAVLSPWFLRNYRAFHQVIPFRDGFGLELRVGNNGDTWNWVTPGLHPSDNEAEWQEYKKVGEIAYIAEKKHQAVEFIGNHPRWFVVMSLRRALYMWTNYWSFDRRYLAQEPFDPPNIFLCTALTALALTGLWRAFRKGLPIAVPLALALFFFPMVYYVTHPQDYYRRPVDPLFVVLAAFVVASRSRLGRGPSTMVTETAHPGLAETTSDSGDALDHVGRGSERLDFSFPQQTPDPTCKDPQHQQHLQEFIRQHGRPIFDARH